MIFSNAGFYMKYKYFIHIAHTIRLLYVQSGHSYCFVYKMHTNN